MHSTIEAPLGREAFESALLSAIEGYPCEETRFYKVVTCGRCPPELLLRYARSTYLSASTFCATIAELIDKAPDPLARLVLLENLLEEEGIFLRPDRGLVVRPECRHPELALRFLKACGGDAEADPVGNGLSAIGPGRQLLAQGRWLEAISFLLVGQELKFSTVSALLFEALRGHGIGDRDLAFFAVHIEADCEHGRQALDLVLDRAHSADQQRLCVAAADAGARCWFEMHGSSAITRRAV